MDALLDMLNDEQKVAASYFEGVCVVTATPGSGKTRTLTCRVINLIKNHNIIPSSILCLTFTNKAAGEMRTRIASMIGQPSEKIWISTFHALCVAILRKYGKDVNLSKEFSIYDESDQKELMTKIMRMHDYNGKDVYELCKLVNNFREDIEDFDQYCQSLSIADKEVIEEYLSLLDKWNAVDFSGILYKTWLLLLHKPQVSMELHNRFRFVLVDEMQDTNTIQYEIVKIITDPKTTKTGNLFVVGDPAQSIFAWRGARPENLNKIYDDFDNASSITLPRNYRSTGKILKAAQNLIRHNNESKDVTLIAERGDGHGVLFRQHADPESEASYVATTIQAMRIKYDYSFKDFAVLYRINALSKQIEIALRKYHIPYKIVGGYSFFDRKEIKDALAYLSVFANPNDTMQFARAISSPKRSIGNAAIGKIEKYAIDHKVPILDAARSKDILLTDKMRRGMDEFLRIMDKSAKLSSGGSSIAEIINCLIKESGYYDCIMQEDQKDGTNRVANLDELLSSIYDYQCKNPKSTISNYLHSVQLLVSDLLDNKNEDDNAVTLLTMHSAKGLEFPVVCIVGAEKGIIPHERSLKENREDEERRLMYVGVSRASNHLYINYCNMRRRYNFGLKRNVMDYRKPSCFLQEMITQK